MLIPLGFLRLLVFSLAPDERLRAMKRTKKIMRINSLMKINTLGSLICSSTLAITNII